jgi:hypothetical protein
LVGVLEKYQPMAIDSFKFDDCVISANTLSRLLSSIV